MTTEEQKKEIIKLKSERYKKTTDEKIALKAAKSLWKNSIKNGTKA